MRATTGTLRSSANTNQPSANQESAIAPMMFRKLFFICSLFLFANLSAQTGTIVVKKVERDTVLARFGKVSFTGEMTAAELAVTDSLQVIPAGWQIVSYRVSFMSGSALYEFSQHKAKFDSLLKERFAALRPGDKIFIEEILVQHWFSGARQRLPAIVVKVK